MKHVKTLNTKTYASRAIGSGCGECQASCQSACKTSCTIGNQHCERRVDENTAKKDQNTGK